MKLINVLMESMADGGAFKAFVQVGVSKLETQANEGLNLVKLSPLELAKKIATELDIEWDVSNRKGFDYVIYDDFDPGGGKTHLSTEQFIEVINDIKNNN
jgi:hypothetical protein